MKENLIDMDLYLDLNVTGTRTFDNNVGNAVSEVIEVLEKYDVPNDYIGRFLKFTKQAYDAKCIGNTDFEKIFG